MGIRLKKLAETILKFLGIIIAAVVITVIKIVIETVYNYYF